MKSDPLLDEAPDWAETVVIKCPDCDQKFKTHDLGDLVDCVHCDAQIERFMNIVEGEIS